MTGSDDHKPHVPGRRFAASAFWRTLPSGMRRRWWLFRPFDLIARHWPVLKRRRGILVVRMDGIGDMVLFRRSLDHYAEAFSVAKGDITVLGCDSWGPIAGEIFKGYAVHAIDEHAYARRLLYRLKVSLWVRRLAPAIAVCDSHMRRTLMADSLVWMSGAPRTVVSLPYINEPTRPEFKYYLSQVGEIIDTGDYPTHEVIRHYRFISAVSGREIKPQPPAIDWRREAPPIEDGAPYVVLNPGSNEPGRRWPLGGYLSVARRLLGLGFRVVFVGTSVETSGEDRLKAFSRQPGVIDLGGRTSLPQLMDVMKHAQGVISNDTGPAHLSIALGVPSVIIVGGGHFGGFVPYPEEVAPANVRFVFEEMECYHCFWLCHKRAGKHDVFPCVSAIGEEKVWNRLEELLSLDSSARREAGT